MFYNIEKSKQTEVYNEAWFLNCAPIFHHSVSLIWKLWFLTSLQCSLSQGTGAAKKLSIWLVLSGLVLGSRLEADTSTPQLENKLHAISLLFLDSYSQTIFSF